MRDLIIEKIIELLNRYGKPTYGSMRWDCVFEYIGILQGIDINSKKGKQALKALDLTTVDLSTLADDQILDYFMLVTRRFYVCM